MPHDGSSKLVALHVDENVANCCLYNLKLVKRSTLARRRLATGVSGRLSDSAVVGHKNYTAQGNLYPYPESSDDKALNIHEQSLARFVAVGGMSVGGR